MLNSSWAERNRHRSVQVCCICPMGSLGSQSACRLAGILRNLSSYYYKEPTLLFLVRIAQASGHVLWGGGGAPPPRLIGARFQRAAALRVLHVMPMTSLLTSMCCCPAGPGAHGQGLAHAQPLPLGPHAAQR